VTQARPRRAAAPAGGEGRGVRARTRAASATGPRRYLERVQQREVLLSSCSPRSSCTDLSTARIVLHESVNLGRDVVAIRRLRELTKSEVAMTVLADARGMGGAHRLRRTYTPTRSWGSTCRGHRGGARGAGWPAVGDHHGHPTTSVTGVLRGAGDGPAVLLRADMDAFRYGSGRAALRVRVPEAMHACGHDCLRNARRAAHLLAARRDELPATCPDVPAGREAGGCPNDDRKVSSMRPVQSDRRVRQHVFSTLPRGSNPRGTMLASSSALLVTCTAKVGHAQRRTSPGPFVVVPR